MKHNKIQLELARTNSKTKAECPNWMQELFESAPRNKLWWYRKRTNNWWPSVDNPWAGGIYRISENWNGE